MDETPSGLPNICKMEDWDGSFVRCAEVRQLETEWICLVTGYKQNRATGVPSSPAMLQLRRLQLHQQQLLSAETTGAAGTADAERAAVADDVGATAGD